MPNWQPNWHDVRWDHAAANSAIAALRRAADRLDGSMDSRNDVASHAEEEWRGVHRGTFDSSMTGMLGDGRHQARALREMAARLARASEDARNEQRQRERDRQRWYDEREDERRREERRREEERERARQHQPR